MMRGPVVVLVASLVAFAIAASWTGCGVKSKPVPPSQARPQRILDLRATPVKGGIRLTWGRPTTYEAGGRMRNLGHFVIMRSDEQGNGFRQIAEVQVTDQARFQQQQVFNYIDRDTTLGQSYAYEIIAYTEDNYKSMPSNEVSLVRTVPQPPPNPENFVLPTPKPLPLP
jgi:hypothetical protein